MITASGIELRAGARILIESASFRIAKGDRIGLVGRNGAGKTTLTKCLAGEGTPAGGTITRSGEVGYLPQDPRTGDLEILARDRILSARGLDEILRKMRENEERMANGKGATREKAMKKYERLETEFLTKGGYAAEAEAATIAAALSLPDRVLGQPLHTLSGGQRRRVELARILFSDADTLLLDEPTNHLDADSIVWLRDYLKTYRGGFIVISHDVDLVETVVNKVFYLDANRSQIDVYNMGWKLYQQHLRGAATTSCRSRPSRRHAIGAGFQLALACDLRIVADDVQFAMRETSLGLVPDLTGTHPLVSLVGYARALEICATGRFVHAEEAERTGLANLVVPADQLDAAARDLAAALIAAPRDAVVETKALLNGASSRTYEEQRIAERAAQGRRLRDLAGITD
ncbi:Carnitinyl-CoA dehydratase [Streptomyces microflavus]